MKAVIDNVSYHKSKISSEAIKQYKRIDPVFLPTSSPKLNLIEGKWDMLQQEAINNQKFNSRDELVEAIERWVDFYNGERKEIYSQRKITNIKLTASA
jgi:transposase